MIKKFAAAGIAFTMIAGAAQAWEGKVIKCYDTVYVPAEYKTHQKLVRAAYTDWEHRNGQAVKVYYPPVYVETRTEVRPARYVNRPAACKD